MMRGTHQLGEQLVSFRIPETTADVLHYRAFITSMDDNEQAIRCAAEWAAAHIEEPLALSSPVALLEYVQELDGMTDLIKLCSAISHSAQIPQPVLDDLGKMLDLQNDIAPDWRPTPKCECPRCRRPEVKENPEGVECMYDGISPIAMNLAGVATGLDAGAASDPYYLTQVRAVVQRSTSRLYAHQREEREKKAQEKAEWDDFRKGAHV